MRWVFAACFAALTTSSALEAQCEFTELIPTTVSPPDSNREFGYAIAGEGGTVLLVGDPLADGPITESGLAHVFQLVGEHWLETAVLFQSDGQDSDRFGEAVDLAGNAAVIGASRDDDNGPESGSAYVFEKQGASWVEAAKLKMGPANGTFGASVSIDGQRILVGAPGEENASSASGSVYVFEKNGTWTHTATLTSPSPVPYDRFGLSVELRGDLAFVGAPGQEGAAFTGPGSVYVFQETGGAWTHVQTLSALVPFTNDEFGRSLAVSNDLLAVGCPRGYFAPLTGGAAYLYRESGGVWSQEAVLTPSSAGLSKVGQFVALDGDLVAVGVKFGGSRAHVFEREAFGWVEKDSFASPVSGERPMAVTSGVVALGAMVYPEPAFGWGSFTQPLLGCPEEVSMLTGGTQVLDITAGSQFAGDYYLVLGSATGTSGFRLQGVQIPLFPDEWFGFSLASANNPPPFINTLGILDTNGTARAQLNFPPGSDPNLAGWTVHHAYITFKLAPFRIGYASNPVSLDLLP